MAPGQMVLAGKVFTTFWLGMVTTSASSRNRRHPLKKMWPRRSVSFLNKMDRAFLSLTAMAEPGENEADDGKRFPSDLSKSNAIKKTADGFTYLDPTQFHEYFAADLPAEQAALMARSQVLNAADNFKAIITTPAWRNKPSWMLVATKDRTINPDLERWYAERAKSHKVEVSGASHSVYVSRPKEVAALIEEAASHAR